MPTMATPRQNGAKARVDDPVVEGCGRERRLEQLASSADHLLDELAAAVVEHRHGVAYTGVLTGRFARDSKHEPHAGSLSAGRSCARSR